MKKRWIYVFAVLFLLGGTAWAQEAELVGKWTTKDGEVLEFNDDGTITQGKAGNLIPGEYTFIGEDRLYIAGEKDDAIWQYQLHGDTLTMYKAEEDTVEYERME